MKARILAILMLFASLSALAQEAPIHQVSFGAGYGARMGAANKNNVTANGLYAEGEYSYAFITGKINLLLTTGASFQYSKNVQEFQDGLLRQRTTSWGDLDVPIFVKLQFCRSEKVTLGLLTGPMLDFGLQNKVEEYGAENLLLSKTDCYEQAEKNRFAVQYAVGAEVIVRNFGIKLAYSFGILNVGTLFGDTSSDVYRWDKLRFGVYYRIPCGEE